MSGTAVAVLTLTGSAQRTTFGRAMLEVAELTREPSNLVGKPRSYNQLVSPGVHNHFESGGARTPVLQSARRAARLFSSVAIARVYERTGRLPSNTRQAPFGIHLTCGLGAKFSHE